MTLISAPWWRCSKRGRRVAPDNSQYDKRPKQNVFDTLCLLVYLLNPYQPPNISSPEQVISVETQLASRSPAAVGGLTF
jgi:hypothetical protein